MSHLCEHKFKHNFQDCLNPICGYGLNIESTSYFLLHCPTFNDERYTLLSTLNKIDCKLLEITKSSLSQTLLHGNTLFDKEKKHSFLTQQSKLLNPSRNFLKCFIILTFTYCLILLYFLNLFADILEFWCLVTMAFKFTVLYNNIYRKKKDL